MKRGGGPKPPSRAKRRPSRSRRAQCLQLAERMAAKASGLASSKANQMSFSAMLGTAPGGSRVADGSSGSRPEGSGRWPLELRRPRCLCPAEGTRFGRELPLNQRHSVQRERPGRHTIPCQLDFQGIEAAVVAISHPGVPERDRREGNVQVTESDNSSSELGSQRDGDGFAGREAGAQARRVSA